MGVGVGCARWEIDLCAWFYSDGAGRLAACFVMDTSFCKGFRMPKRAGGVWVPIQH